MRRSKSEEAAGWGLVVLGVAGVAVASDPELTVDGATVALWALALAGVGGWRSRQRRRRRRAEARARRDARVAARAQRLDVRLLRRVGAAGRPIGVSTPLPRSWSEPVRAARAAVEDYRCCALSLPPGPVRDRLLEGLRPMETASAELAAVARRGAELERQLRRLRRRSAPAPGGGPTGQPPADRQLRERIERSATSVAAARARVRERLQALQCAAIDAADVAVTLSVAEVGDLGSGVDGSLARVAGLAEAVEEATVGPQQPRAPVR